MVQAVAAVTARVALLAGLLLLPGAAGAQTGPRLTVPPGLAIDVFAESVGRVRFMAIDPAGTLLVSEPARGRVLALPDRNGTGKAEAARTVVEGLDGRDGALYLSDQGAGRIYRIHYRS